MKPNERKQLWLPSLVTSAVLLFALARFYRRFVYDDVPGSRLWAISDDVYISACFGRSLFAGHGLLWYPGAAHVEGISNPLWSVLIGLTHLLPGFTEERLGLFVVAINATLLLATSYLFWLTLSRTRGQLPDAQTLIGCALLSVCVTSLAYWSAEGFEVALVCVFAFALLAIARRAPERSDTWLPGLLLTLGIATRMDFVLVAAPALVIFSITRRDEPKTLLRVAIVTGLSCGLLLAARYAYYGDLLPNTYYLKSTGWPAPHRWAMGWSQNRVLVVTTLVLWLPWMIPAVRRALGTHAMPVALAWLSFSMTVLYSTASGGDSWRLYLGYDRHTVVGGVLMLWGFCVLLVNTESRTTRVALALWACVACATPIVGSDAAIQQARAGLFERPGPTRKLEREWALYGKAMTEITRPNARIAVCAAGALIYFSHRGGVDQLGKVEPLVAHSTVLTHDSANSLCWRNVPGHNKGDDETLFRVHTPDVSRNKPPARYKPLYRRVVYKGHKVYLRRDSDRVRWDKIKS